MEKLSDTALEIINELHTERLDYTSEYLPLINAAQRLAHYEDLELTPEEIKEQQKVIRRLFKTLAVVCSDTQHKKLDFARMPRGATGNPGMERAPVVAAFEKICQDHELVIHLAFKAYEAEAALAASGKEG